MKYEFRGPVRSFDAWSIRHLDIEIFPNHEDGIGRNGSSFMQMDNPYLRRGSQMTVLRTPLSERPT